MYDEVIVADSASVSGKFSRLGTFGGAHFPDVTDGNIGLEISRDGGITWAKLLDPVDGSEAILCTSGQDAGWIDFTDWIRFIPPGARNIYMRFTCAVQSGAKTIGLLWSY